MVREVERNAAVARADRIDSPPYKLAGRAEQVEIGVPVRIDARRQDFGLEHAGRKGRALNLLDGAEERVHAAARMVDALPVELQPRERRLLDGLHLLPQLRQGAPPEPAQDLGVAGRGQRAREELALQDTLLLLQPLQGKRDRRGTQPEPPPDVLRTERPVCARVARDEIAQRVPHGLEQLPWHSPGWGDAQRIAHPRGVLRRYPALLAGDGDRESAALSPERLEPILDGRLGNAPRRQLLHGEIAQPEQ